MAIIERELWSGTTVFTSSLIKAVTHPLSLVPIELTRQ